jgi:hypothetical protein
MQRTKALLAITCIAVFFSSAPAQARITQDQCRAMARALPSATVPLDDFISAIQAIAWDNVLPTLDGELLTIAQKAKNAQATLVTAMKEYKNALEDFTHQLQLCTR